MTPARLEELDKTLGSEHPPDQRTLMGIAHELLAEVKRLRETLEIIADPIAHLQAEAKARGERLDGGMAIHVSQDAGWHQQRARQALAGEEPTP